MNIFLIFNNKTLSEHYKDFVTYLPKSNKIKLSKRDKNVNITLNINLKISNNQCEHHNC